MVKATIFVEAQANRPGVTTQSLEKLIVDLRDSGDFITGDDISDEEMERVEDKDVYTSFAEISVDMPLRDFMKLCIRTTPSSLEIDDAESEISSKEALYLIGDMCNVIGTCCTKMGVRIPLPQTQFGDEVQDGPGMDEEEFEDLIDKGFIHFKFVARAAGEEDIVIRDTIRVINVFGGYVNKIKLEAEGEQPEGKFSGLVAIEALIPSFETLFDLAVRFSPVAMAIEYPEVIKVSLFDLQNLAIMASSLMTDITNYVTIKQNKLDEKQ